MYLNKKIANKVFESWAPKITEKIGAAKAKAIPEARLRALAVLANTRMLHAKKGMEQSAQAINESYATLSNVVGRSSYNFGNNPQNGNAEFYQKMGSGEVYANLFGVFIEVVSNAFAMDLVPMIPMTKSSIGIYIAEPVYAGGNLDSASDKPLVIQVKISASGTPTALVVGQTYTLKTGNAGENVADVTYVGKHRLNGYAVFRVGQQYDNSGGGGTNWKNALTAALFASPNGIYFTAANHWDFDSTTVDYVAGFTNRVAGFTGAGNNDTAAWYMNRQDGSAAGTLGGQPMSRYTGSRTAYRSMGVRQWSKNVEAKTTQIDIELQTEQIQDMIMDHDMDANEFADSIIAQELTQAINDHILGRMFALGWSNHYAMNQINASFNLNTYIADSATTSQPKTFVGKEDTPLTIAGVPGVLPATGAISENLSTLQRRVVTRMLFGSGIINQRSRRGRGDQGVMNTQQATAVKDVRGFSPAPFDNTLDFNAGLAYIGDLYGIRCYEDGLMELADGRINISRHGNEKDPGIKFCPYLLAERISTIAEGTMGPKIALKSRYGLPEAGTYPELNYLTFYVESAGGYAIV